MLSQTGIQFSYNRVTQFIMMKIEVKKAIDIELSNNEELEARKIELRKKIKSARRLLSMEANKWDKQLLKCEEKSKAGKLTIHQETI